MKTLSCLLILAMLSGCVKRPDSFSFDPIIEHNKEICKPIDLYDAFQGATFSFTWRYEGLR